MNANNAQLTALTTTRSGSLNPHNAPNAPAAASFDLVLTAVADSNLVRQRPLASWVVNAAAPGTVTELGPDGSMIGLFTVGTGPQGIAFDGAHMWVTNGLSDIVTELGPAGNVLGTLPVGHSPVGIAADHATHMWVANSGSNNVTELNTT